MKLIESYEKCKRNKYYVIYYNNMYKDCTDVAFTHVSGDNSRFYNCILDILYRIDPDKFDVHCGIVDSGEKNRYSKNELDVIFEMTEEEVYKHILMEIM